MIAQHLLVPTDFSEYANHALDYAIELANRLQARLTLLHVVQLAPLAMDDYDSSGFVSYLEEMEADAQQGRQASRAPTRAPRRGGNRSRGSLPSDYQYSSRSRRGFDHDGPAGANAQ